MNHQLKTAKSAEGQKTFRGLKLQHYGAGGKPTIQAVTHTVSQKDN